MGYRATQGTTWHRVGRVGLTLVGVALGIVASPDLALLVVAVVAGLAAASTVGDMAQRDAADRLALAALLLLVHPVLLIVDGRSGEVPTALLAPACIASAWALARLHAYVLPAHRPPEIITIIDITDAAAPRLRRPPTSRAEAEQRSAWVDPPLDARTPGEDPWHVGDRRGGAV